MSQALYRKWRPHQWAQVVGQDHVVRTLQNAISSNRVGHAYLFAGPRGTGKTTTARLLAKAVNCLSDDNNNRPCDQCENCVEVNENRFLDLIEIDAASNTSVEDIRELREKINFSPSTGVKKIYIIDEVHMLSTAAFNALLKTLEEPPEHAIFILATTEIHKIPATVLSRCQRHEFRRIPVNDISSHLKELCSQEEINIDDEALKLIARQSTGSLRDAISLLDQLSSSGEIITLEITQNLLGTATNEMVVELVDAILSQNTAAGFEIIHQALDSGNDPRQLGRQVVEYLRDILLIHMGNADQIEATQEMRARMAAHASQFKAQHLLTIIKAFNSSTNDGRSSWYPGLNLELAFAEAIDICKQTQNPIEEPGPASAPQYNPTPTQAAPAVAENPQEFKPKETNVPVAQPTSENLPITEDTSVNITTGDGSVPDLNSIMKNWPKIRSLVKKHRSQTEGLLNSCKPLKIQNGVLFLGFASNVLKSKMEDGKNIELARQAINHVLGTNINITCTVINSKSSDIVDLGTDHDGMVGEALNLGGKITHQE